MPADPHRHSPDLPFRLAGLVLILIAAAALYGLIHLIRAGAHHPATIAELLVGAAGFAAASTGGALLMLGAHLLDPVATSERRQASEVTDPHPSGDNRRPVR